MKKNTKEYWNNRVKEYKNDETKMIWCSHSSDEFTEYLEPFLRGFGDKKVLDIGCGFGRFAPLFQPRKYVGVDFSDELIKLARAKYPEHHFYVEDLNTYTPPEAHYDIIMEVMVCSSAGVSREAFVKRFLPYAKVAVICVEPENILIVPAKPFSA